jgi:hypothetical protein
MTETVRDDGEKKWVNVSEGTEKSWFSMGKHWFKYRGRWREAVGMCGRVHILRTKLVDKARCDW